MEEWFELMTLEASRQELKRVLECNQETSKYGLSLTEEEARELMACRKETLRESRRVEFAAGILPELIKEFCDSQFIQSGEYVDTLARLQEIFYLYKNESMDELPVVRRLCRASWYGHDVFHGICFEFYAGKLK